jgi:hypothetical protein
MFNTIKTWITWEVQSVEGIISAFTATVTKLEDHAQAMYARAVHLDQVVIEEASKVIEKAQAEIDAVHAEATKAINVAAKIKALL